MIKRSLTHTEGPFHLFLDVDLMENYQLLMLRRHSILTLDLPIGKILCS